MAGKLVLAGRKGLYYFADGNDTTNFANGVQLISATTGLLIGGTTITAASITRTQLSAAAGSKIQEARPATIATTSNTDVYMIVGETGTITSIDFSGVDALAASDTNYITFSVTNLGQAGAGSTAILAATDANTTKSTGGTALAANTKRTLTLNGTAANLNVTAGDRLRIRAAATGTLDNTVTFPVYCVRFSGTT